MIDPTFRDTLRYQSRAEPASLLADLKELHRRSESARSRRKTLIVCLAIWGVGSIVLGVAVKTVIAPAIITGVVGCALLGLPIWRASQLIIPERRGKLAATVVRALACDVPGGGEIELKLDFGPAEQDGFLTDSRALPGTKAAAYRQPWLAVTARLANGSEIALGVELLTRRKERTKRKGRTKIKETLHERVALTIRVPELPPGAVERWPEQVRRAVLPEGASVHRALVKKDRLSLELRTHPQTRITDKGNVVTGADCEDRLATRHTLLVPVLAAYHTLAACSRKA